MNRLNRAAAWVFAACLVAGTLAFGKTCDELRQDAAREQKNVEEVHRKIEALKEGLRTLKMYEKEHLRDIEGIEKRIAGYEIAVEDGRKRLKELQDLAKKYQELGQGQLVANTEREITGQALKQSQLEETLRAARDTLKKKQRELSDIYRDINSVEAKIAAAEKELAEAEARYQKALELWRNCLHPSTAVVPPPPPPQPPTPPPPPVQSPSPPPPAPPERSSPCWREIADFRSADAKVKVVQDAKGAAGPSSTQIRDRNNALGALCDCLKKNPTWMTDEFRKLCASPSSGLTAEPPPPPIAPPAATPPPPPPTGSVAPPPSSTYVCGKSPCDCAKQNPPKVCKSGSRCACVK